jgi:hydrogenase maturation protein HypF
LRPYVWRLANELGLHGWVKNDAAGVLVAVDGEKTAEFIRRLPVELPPLARIDQIDVEAFPAIAGEGFSILASSSGEIATTIGPDAAICPDCIADICDPANRRWRYAFTTCTHCGPRYSVSRKIPYDRANTSLAEFPLCPACQAEYAALPDEKSGFTAVDRRFHAETTACPNCGPQLQLLDTAGQPLAGDPLAETLRLLQEGKIVAIKGLGGFHLACDARNAAAVTELRQRKQREEKPFAVMGLNAASFSPYACLGNEELNLLHSPAAPIVLCPKGAAELPAIAPGLAWLGVMLPTTPLHLLLWHEAAGRPSGTAWQQENNELLLVMTSANPHGEPLVIDNAEAVERLHGIADAFLVHDRAIVVRCDDSVVRAGSSGPAFIRRARGYVPLPIALAEDGPVVLALGGHLKNTVCVLKGRQAFLSQHIGGLDNAPAIAFLEESVQHLLAILEVRPQLIAHDLHPDYASTHLALRLAAELDVPALAVPHHQAHLAALAAEQGIAGPLLGLALDGVGLGPDGSAWGGELLRLDGAHCQRLGQLSPLKLPGAERAAREPWRMGLAALHAAGMSYRIGGWLKQHYPEREGGPLITMLDRNLRCPPTSSLGRWFDAAAGLLGVREMAHYEGQAAMELEGLAAAYGPVAPLKNGFLLHDGQLDLTPLIPALLVCHDKAEGAALFHATVAAGLAAWALAAVNGEKQSKIAIAGGCAMNAVLTNALRQHLAIAGIELLEARQAPPNDGGLALGQAWVARQQFNAVQ